MQSGQYSLVAEIGGSNARLALIADDSKTPLEPCNLAGAEYPNSVDAVRDYFAQVNLDEPYQSSISVASGMTAERIYENPGVLSHGTRQYDN